jgi:predicted  nucleic acid-binding Zn-ribbon protein
MVSSQPDEVPALRALVEEMRQKFQKELLELREQLSVLQAKLSEVEAQVAHFEPMVEARAARTDRIVLELQVEFRRWQKEMSAHESVEVSHHSSVQTKLDKILEALS